MKNKCLFCGCDIEKTSNQNKKFCSPNCRARNSSQKKIIGIEGVDYVICKICGLKFKEINADHLFLHNISKECYDELYGNRTSLKTKERKNTLERLLTPEFSKKLSYSHTINNYIEKYGEEKGVAKHKERNNNMQKCKTLEYYVEKYGEIIGTKKFKDTQLKKAITIENLIKKHGEEVGTEKYNNWKIKQKNKNSIKYYIDKYGYEIGLEKWFKKNDKISEANSKIPKHMRKKYTEYCYKVNKFSRISLQLHELENINLRGVINGYDLDHKVSKINGFKNNILPEIIGHISNLAIITMTENRKKQHNSSEKIEEITIKFEKDKQYQDIIEKLHLEF